MLGTLFSAKLKEYKQQYWLFKVKVTEFYTKLLQWKEYFLMCIKKQKHPSKKDWNFPVISILICSHLKPLIIKKYSVGLQEKGN